HSKGDSVSLVASASTEGPIPPKTAKQKLARKNKLKAKSTLMLAIPDEHLLKFNACKDANIALIMRNKYDLDTLSTDDLYNNMKMYESKIKGQSSSSSNSQNVAFVSSDNTSSTNDTVNTAYSVSAASSKNQASTASYADDIDIDDLGEMDLKWQMAMLTMRVKRRGHFARECKASSNQGNRNRDAPIRNALVNTSTTNALVVQDGIDLKNQLENASKEKDDLKLKLEKFETSSKNLTKLINSQISAVDKTGLGYDGQMIECDVNNSKVLNNVVDSFESDGDDNQVNYRFKKDNSVFKSKVRETTTSVPKIETKASKTSKDSLEKPKTVRKLALSFMKPFGFPATIVNTLDRLGKFDGKSDDDFFVGYSTNRIRPNWMFNIDTLTMSMNYQPVFVGNQTNGDAGYSTNSKAFRVFNTRTRIVEENLHITFLENKPNVVGIRPNWMFNIDTLTMSMNYQPVFIGNQTNGDAGTKENINAGQAGKKIVPGLQYVADDVGKKSTKVLRKENGVHDPAKEGEAANTNSVNTVSSPVNAVSFSLTTVDPEKERTQRNEFESMFGQDKDANGNKMFTPVSASRSTYIYLGGSILVNVATLPNVDLSTDHLMPDLEDSADTGSFRGAYNDEVEGAKDDFNNLGLIIVISPIPTTRIHKDHPKEQIIGDHFQHSKLGE
nr:hypothetical protein [Tanacetum cinerariifolium]